MNVQRFGLLIALASLAGSTACQRDTGGITNTLAPLAYVRVVHAMPDLGKMTGRLVDSVENLNVVDVDYRYVGPYQGVGAGNRHLRIFPSSENITIASTILIDSTITFTAGSYYTLLATGNTQGGAKAKFIVLNDTPPTPSSSQFALRTVVAAPGVGPVDVFASATGGTAPLPATASMGNVSATSAYVTFPTAASLVLRATAAGSTTPVMVESTVLAGAAGTSVQDPIAGSTQGGSVLTAFLFPRSVAGSGAANFTTPGIAYGIDRRPPRPTS
ncbi:MAG: hypothetical protein JWM41_1900 [Gemmatimonadetes bacterium]|nr:hypothetical protein [Gemmatimonadota bacterium]